MLYFIPAWYSEGSWSEDEQFWHARRMKTEVDDTVKQIQLFHRNSVCDYKILLLSYAPNFRHFLHRQGTFRAPYWSAFDAIQEVRRKKQAILSFHNLNWPKDIEFLYTAFSMFAMRNREIYANMEFGEYGNLIQIDLYRGGQISRKNIYDDRGFVSCTSVYQNGKKAYDQYLTDQGVWKLCHFADGHVAVNPRSNQYLIRTPEAEEMIPFSKAAYQSMEEVLEEVLASALRATKEPDIFCAAAHQQHLAMLGRQLAGRKTIFSVFSDRLSLTPGSPAMEALSRGDYIVTDSEENFGIISRQEGLEHPVKTHIPPYDTRIEPGISQHLSVQKILVPVDHLSAETLEAVISNLAAYLKKNADARVHLFTRNAAYGYGDVLLERVAGILERRGYPPGWAGKDTRNVAEVTLDAEDQIPVLFAVEQCVNELEVNKCMREQRVFADLADSPDLFLQISCVSIGIPQILKTATEYMRPGRNGRINTDLSQLGEDLDYYLSSLSNWNQAAVQSFELGKTHTTQYLIDLWKKVIASIEDNTGITAGSG